MKLTRTYKLKIYGNKSKLEDLRYSSSIFKKYTQHFITQLYFSQKKYISTEGMGSLANISQKKAIDVLKAHRESNRGTGNKSNIPQIRSLVCPAKIKPSKDSSFDYWVGFISQWKNKFKVPAKSHKPLNKALKNNWILSEYCELKEIKGFWYVSVFLSKEVESPSTKDKSLGVDVGITHAATRSDNYLGHNLSKLIKEEKKKQVSRQKNKHKKKEFKSKIKQVLDSEVNRVLRRSKKLNTNIAIENPKGLANLKTGKLQGWARSYFGNRLLIRAKEEGVWVTLVNPAYTSITCSECGKIDRKSRVKQSKFICSSCKSEFHADINAARNIALKGQERVVNLLIKTPVDV